MKREFEKVLEEINKEIEKELNDIAIMDRRDEIRYDNLINTVTLNKSILMKIFSQSGKKGLKIEIMNNILMFIKNKESVNSIKIENLNYYGEQVLYAVEKLSRKYNIRFKTKDNVLSIYTLDMIDEEDLLAKYSETDLINIISSYQKRSLYKYIEREIVNSYLIKTGFKENRK